MDHARPPRNRRAHSLSKRLDREWRLISSRRHLIERARRWRLTDQPFEDLDELLLLAGHDTASTPGTDDVMARLVETARHDDLAWRIVLQRILPGLMAVVRRRHSATDHAVFEQLLGSAWLVIHTYRTDLRSSHVAANLVRDAAYQAFTAPGRRMSATELSIDPHVLDEIPAVVVLSSCEELANLLADAREMDLDATDLEFVKELLRCGSSSRLAAELKVTTRTVRNRRTRTAARLRECAMVA